MKTWKGEGVDIVGVLKKCTCHEAYKGRSLDDPECQYHSGYHQDAIEEIEKLREALRKLEWANLEPHPFYQVMMACCPACRAKFKGSGHRDDCWLAELIREGGER